jgi:hypothetical protein
MCTSHSRVIIRASSFTHRCTIHASLHHSRIAATPTFVDYWKVGATGFGIGSSLYKPGVTAAEIAGRAAQFTEVS